MAHLLAEKYRPPIRAQTQAKMATALFIVSIPTVIVFDSINGVESFIGRGRSHWRRIKFRQVLHCILNGSVHHVATPAADAGLRLSTRMRAGSLRQNEKTAEDKDRDDSRSQRAAQGKAAIADGLVEEIADGRAQRPRQNECRPEQRGARYMGPVIGPRDNRQCDAEYQRSAVIS